MAQLQSMGERRLLFAASMICGFIAAGIASKAEYNWWVAGGVTTLAYPVIGSVAVWICRALREWAYLGRLDPWSPSDRIAGAAGWPFLIVFAATVYPTINRLFSDD